MEARDEDQIDTDQQLQFHSEWTQWSEEQELHDEALNVYLIALCSYYGNRDEQR
jgi:hypothetical protein